MKICYIADGGGNAIHTQKWVNYFAKNHQVSLITFNEAEDFDKNVKIYKIGCKFPKGKRGEIKVKGYKNKIIIFKEFLKFIKKSKKIINEIKPDILHAHVVSHYGFAGALSGFHPLVISAWGSDVLIRPKKSFVMKLTTKYVLKKSDLITCDAEYVKKTIVKMGINSQKINFIHFVTDTDEFNPKKRSKKMREKLGVFDSPMIISSRHLEPIYDIKTLINSIPFVLKEIPNAKFIIASTGTQKDELKRLTKSLNIDKNVNFVGLIPIKKMPQYLASSDVYVSTSLSDGGLAVSTKDAMACELPVVITDLMVNKQWIENGVNGFLFPIKDSKKLAENIIKLLKNKNLRIKFGVNGKKMVQKEFNYFGEMNKMEKLYEKLYKKIDDVPR